MRGNEGAAAPTRISLFLAINREINREFLFSGAILAEIDAFLFIKTAS
jgi:hypothetical protein